MRIWTILALAAVAGAGAAQAGEKIVFSGRDGRPAQYHRSLNARPLFAPLAIESGFGNGESPLDALNAPPSMRLRSSRSQKDADDQDWIFKSPEELGSEGIEKEMLGEDEEEEEWEQDGIKRTPVERYLERKREKRLKTPDSKTDPDKISQAAKELDEDPLLAVMKARQSADSAFAEPKSALDLARESRGAPVVGQAFSGQEAALGGGGAGLPMGSRDFMEYQREQVNKLKQTLGISAAFGVRPNGGAGPSSGLLAGGRTGTAGVGGSGPSAEPGLPMPGSIGAYPGSQGLGLKELTAPVARPGMLLLPKTAEEPPPRPRERFKPTRLKQPKRKMF